MNTLFTSWEQGWQIAGWTMVYFLVIGTLVAIAAAALRLILRSDAPPVRYATSLAGFAVLALLPVGIAGWLFQVASQQAIQNQLLLMPALPAFELPVPVDDYHPRLAEQPAWPTPRASKSEPSLQDLSWSAPQIVAHLPWIWLMGTPLTFLLLASGLIGAERLRRSSQPVAEEPLQKSCQKLRAALGISRRVGLAVCDRVATPLLVGIVRPLILLPPAALSGWSAAELEMVLLHELAHVRRWDNLANLLQRVVESLLFFHPAVWITSRWVRRDREDCCDAVVVAHTAAPQAYAELLLSLASPTSTLAGAALAHHPLAGRIRRILHLEDESMLVSRNTMAVVGTLLLSLALAVSCYGPRETEADEAPASEAEIATTEDTEGTEEGDLFSEETVVEVEVVATEAQEASRVVPGDATKSLFPTLEEQRAADVAYKLLGVELEKLSDEEIERVKAMGHQGGLRVSAYGEGGFGRGNGGPLRNGDLLVGLHVWPTTSLDQVNHVLSRDDLDRLSPLKFYVIRRQAAPRQPPAEGYGEGEYGAYGETATMVDQLVTGRIAVNLDAWRVMQQRPERRIIYSPPGATSREIATLGMLQQQISQLDHEIPSLEHEVKQLEHELSRLESDAEKRAVMHTMEEVHAHRDQIMRAREEAVAQMEQLWLKYQQRLDAGPENTPSDLTAPLPTLPNAPPGSSLPVEHEEELPTGDQTKELDTTVIRDWRGRAVRASKDKVPTDPSTVLYDGKTFDQWRELWKTELKTENRIECIRALAAFGRAGRGKEAAAAILEMAEQYEFSPESTSPFKNSMRTSVVVNITEALIGKNAISVKHWLPLLNRLLEENPSRWQALAISTISQIQSDDHNIRASLKSLARESEMQSAVKGAALVALVGQSDAFEDQEIVAMVHEALSAKDPLLATKVLGALKFSQCDIFPELFDLLFHEVDEIRHTAAVRL